MKFRSFKKLSNFRPQIASFLPSFLLPLPAFLPSFLPSCPPSFLPSFLPAFRPSLPPPFPLVLLSEKESCFLIGKNFFDGKKVFFDWRKKSFLDWHPGWGGGGGARPSTLNPKPGSIGAVFGVSEGLWG